MPEIGVVQKPGLFEDLLKRLGVNRPLRPFTLDGNMVPVVLVESGVSFVAAPAPPYAVTDIFTAGLQIAPALNFILADTGPLPVGSYTVSTVISIGEIGTVSFQWRDAADAANLFFQEFRNPANVTNQYVQRFLVENDNERFRVSVNIAGGAGARYMASIMARI